MEARRGHEADDSDFTLVQTRRVRRPYWHDAEHGLCLILWALWEAFAPASLSSLADATSAKAVAVLFALGLGCLRVWAAIYGPSRYRAGAALGSAAFWLAVAVLAVVGHYPVPTVYAWLAFAGIASYLRLLRPKKKSGTR